MEKNGGAVLLADVWPLPVERGRVVHLPERIQQPVIAHLCRIERHLYHLGVSRGAGANVMVGGVLQIAAQVAGHSFQYSWDLAESLLHTPEAARAKRSFLSHDVLNYRYESG